MKRIGLTVRKPTGMADYIDHAKQALKATASSRICRRATLAIFGAMLLINTVLIIPLYYQVRHEYHLNIQAQAESYLGSIVDAGRLPAVDVLVSMSENLVKSSDLAGGVFVNSSGDVRGVFGDRPTLTWADMKLASRGFRLHRRTADGYHEFFVPGDRVGFNLGTIVRYDGRRLWSLMRARLLTFAGLALIGTLAISVVLSIIMAIMVMYPLQRLNHAIAKALDAPERAREYLTGFDSDDEVGATSRALDRLLTLLSAAHADNILTPAAIIERIPNPIITFDTEGLVINANTAAKELFGYSVTADFAKIDWSSCVLVDGAPVSIAELSRDGAFQCGGELQLASGPTACLIGGSKFIGPDGEFAGTCLVLTIASDLLEDMRNERNQRANLEKQMVGLKRRNAELKHTLDACAALIVADDEPVKRISLNPEHYMAEWLGSGGAGDTRFDDVRHTAIPPILGDSQDGRRVFEWALTILAIRSRSAESRVVVDVTINDEEQVIFRFREPENPQNSDEGVAMVDPYADTLILASALRKLLARQKAELISTGGAREGNIIEFSFGLDAAGMVILKAEQERKAAKRAA